MAAAAARPENAPGTAVEPVDPKKHAIALLKSDGAMRRITPLLGAGADYERVIAEAWLAIQANPKIAECSDLEIVKGVARAVSTGGTIGRDVYLVPFKVKGEGKLEVVEDYKFLAKMIQAAGGARQVTAGVVYEGDFFEFEFGTEQFIRHRPLGAPANRAITHAYAIARIRQGYDELVVLTREEIDAVRREHSKSWNTKWEKGQQVPIALEEIPWYGMKTCVRRVAKLLPSNPRLTAALERLGLNGDSVDGDGLLELPEGTVPALPREQQHPRGEQLPPGGYEYEAGTEARATEVPTRVAASPAVNPGVLRAAAATPDPYALDEAPAHEGPRPHDDQADFDFEDDDGPLPHEMSDADVRGRERERRDADAAPPCPKCGGEMWDNRATKTKPTQPDYRCKDAPKRRGEPGCDGVIWPERDR